MFWALLDSQTTEASTLCSWVLGKSSAKADPIYATRLADGPHGDS